MTAPAGQVGNAAVSTAAKTADASACPPTGTRENDSLPCSGARVRQINTVTAVTPVDHVVAIGTPTVVRMTAPGSDSTAIAERDAVSGQSGLVDVQATRTLGGVYLGGFPTSGMTAPTGMSATNTADNNYCMRVTGYGDTARVYAGARSATAPAASITGGSFIYYNSGTSSYVTRSVSDATLSTLAFTCTTTQVISGATVIWRVTVNAGGVTPATVPAAKNQVLATDSQVRLEQEATVQPIKVTFRYQVIVNGTNEVDLTVSVDPGTLSARGVYGPPPAAG